MLAELKKIKYKHASLKLLLGLLTLSVLLSNFSREAMASGSPPPAITNACNDQFYSMMGNNAFMNAEREITASEVVIRKPDSVLEYSCFDQDVAMIAEDIADDYQSGGYEKILENPTVQEFLKALIIKFSGKGLEIPDREKKVHNIIKNLPPEVIEKGLKYLRK